MVPGILTAEPLGKHVQYGIGGAADWYLDVEDRSVLPVVLQRCAAEGLPVTVIGAGSNALILDGGIRGLVIKLTERKLRIIDDATIELSGGYMMPRAALDLAKQGIAGLEFGIGIPGTVGASVWGNAGAFTAEIKDVLISCEVLDHEGSITTRQRDDCGFVYRRSRFRDEMPGCVVVNARFSVVRDDPAAVRARTDAIQVQRKAAQPYGIRSLGSVFKNPPDDKAGRLIEAAGLKGRRVGGAEIYQKHANFIINVEAATAADVIALVEIAHDAVLTQFGVDLEREIIYLGEAAPVAEPAG